MDVAEVVRQEFALVLSVPISDVSDSARFYEDLDGLRYSE